jgi:putative restriction endonuclease
MTLDKYIDAFSNLRTDKAAVRWSDETNNRAPHKPLLLLSIIDLFAQGTITANLIEPDLELGELFSLYWAKVMPPDRDGNIALPFYHLSGDGFWHLQPKPGNESAINVPIRSIIQLCELAFGAKFDDELYIALHSEEHRNLFRAVLIETYFSVNLQAVLLNQSNINLASYHYSQQLLDQARKKQTMSSENIEEPVRDQGFRRAVVSAYNHRCAFCGVRMLTPENHTAVDAAHIIPWSYSHNDDPRNGLALCKLCHWTFDKGLVSVSSKYQILISPQLNNADNISGHIGTLSQRDLILPSEEVFYPEKNYLDWHRREKFYPH